MPGVVALKCFNHLLTIIFLFFRHLFNSLLKLLRNYFCDNSNRIIKCFEKISKYDKCWVCIYYKICIFCSKEAGGLYKHICIPYSTIQPLAINPLRPCHATIRNACLFKTIIKVCKLSQSTDFKYASAPRSDSRSASNLIYRTDGWTK